MIEPNIPSPIWIMLNTKKADVGKYHSPNKNVGMTVQIKNNAPIVTVMINIFLSFFINPYVAAMPFPIPKTIIPNIAKLAQLVNGNTPSHSCGNVSKTPLPKNMDTPKYKAPKANSEL